MPIRRFLLPHRMQEILSCCPRGVTQYAAFNLDSIAKILNHTLVLMFFFNCMLFLASWKVSFFPNVGLSTVLISYLLCFQNAAVFLILNNGYRIRWLAFLQPTEFLLGVALGISIGGMILSFVLSGAFRSISRCKLTTMDESYEQLCTKQKGSLSAIWFWSGLVFWLNVVTVFLLTIGRYELIAATATQYESLETEDNTYNYQGQQQQQQQPIGHGNAMNTAGSFPGDMPNPAFVGDYTTVPEVRDTSGAPNNNLQISDNTVDERQSIITSV